MAEARILHCEDSKEWQGIVVRALDGSPHSVVHASPTVPDSLAAITRIAEGELDANVLLLGGALTKGHRLPIEFTGARDPQRILARVEELGLVIKTLGLSGRAMSDYGVEVDAEIHKLEFEAVRFQAVLSTLVEPNFLPE